MALDAHLDELNEKHRALEKRLDNEMARPQTDSLLITKLKREKLQIKDEIARLREASSKVA